MAGGRPSKFDIETKNKLTNAIKEGYTLKAACAYADIDFSTFRRWIMRGEKLHKAEYCEFCETIKKAEELAKVALVEQWKRHFADSWQAIATYMERRWPEEYGRKNRTRIHTSQQLQIEDLTIDKQLLGDSESRKLVEQICQRMKILETGNQKVERGSRQGLEGFRNIETKQ